MRKPDGFDNVEAIGNNEYKRLPAGGYVARITKVTDVPEKNHLHLEFDIAEGEYMGYGAACLERNGFTPLNTRVYYDTNTPKSDPTYEKKHKTVPLQVISLEYQFLKRHQKNHIYQIIMR